MIRAWADLAMFFAGLLVDSRVYSAFEPLHTNAREVKCLKDVQ